MLFAQSGTRTPTPISSRINAELPSWLRFGGEERVRMDSVAGQGFQPGRDLYLLNRLRINIDLRPGRWVSFSFQGQDSRVFGQKVQPAPASQKNVLDLRLGFLQIGGEERWTTIRVGRQTLDFGEGRLVADPNWSNVGRTFDAARVTFRHGRTKLDLFTGASVKGDPLKFDTPVPAEHFHGAYGTLAGLAPNATIEPYVFWRLEHAFKSESGKLGNLDEKTIGVRWAGKSSSGLDYSAEIAGQTDSWAGDRIGAWMGHWVAGYTVIEARHKPRIWIEYNRASGDQGSKDGRHGSFSVLFPSTHDKYGLTDLFCSSNIVHLRSCLQYAVSPKLTLSGAYNDFWLADPRDGLYVGGKVVARSATGTAATHVGREADVQAQWRISRSTLINVGYGHLFPGDFLRNTTSGEPYQMVFSGISQTV